MYNNQFSLSIVRILFICKLTKFTSIFRVFDLLFFLRHQTAYIYICILGDCKTSLVLSTLLSLSLSLISPTHCIAVPLCPQSRQKRFVRSPRKIPPHVYYNIRIPSPRSASRRFRETTDASSGRNKTGDPWHDAAIWFMWSGASVFDVSGEVESKRD